VLLRYRFYDSNSEPLLGCLIGDSGPTSYPQVMRRLHLTLVLLKKELELSKLQVNPLGLSAVFNFFLICSCRPPVVLTFIQRVLVCNSGGESSQVLSSVVKVVLPWHLYV
jgi:hypothetical protein